ncbi:MAG: GYD domain-containing protein [Nitrosopumilaceae archaeon]
MIFIALIKFRRKAKDVAEFGKKLMQNLPGGVKILGSYWTLGRFDAVWIYEAPNEKVAMQLGIEAGELMQTQTLVAVSRDEALKLLK